MKDPRPTFNSHKKIVKVIPSSVLIKQSIRHGETIVPAGSDDLGFTLTKTSATYTYNIINTDKMSGAIKLACSDGSFKGLILNTSQGSLSIDPITLGTKQVQFANTIKDGSYISTLSDGNDWFIWSYGIGAGLGTSTTSPVAGIPGLSGGGSNGAPKQSVTPAVVYDDVVITNIATTVDFSNGPAEHDLSFTGTAHPSTVTDLVRIKVFTPGPVEVGDVPVANDGSWDFAVNDLGNGSHQYTFEAFIGGLSIKKNDVYSELLDGGALEFDCPTIEIEVGTSSPDFTTFPTVQHVTSNGVITPVTATVNSTTYADTQAEDDTFNVVFEYTYDAVTYQRTVVGVVVNLIKPAVPVISTVGGNASGVAINTTTVNIEGTAAIGATVDVYIDGQPNTPIATVTANGSGQWTISSHNFGWGQNTTVILKAQQQTVNGSLWSDPSTDFSVVYEQNVLATPTIDITGHNSGDFTNQANPFTITGTGIAGSEVTLNGATPLSSPITVAGGGTWTTTVNLTHDALHDISAQATKAGFVNSQQSTTFQINVDRTNPVLDSVSELILFLDNVNDVLPGATDFSSVSVAAAYSPTLANAEGTYTATYTATDAAGNTSSNSRDIKVTSPVIIPVITSTTDAGGGTVLVQGTVTGTYAHNLDVQIMVDGVNNGSPVTVTGYPNGTFTYTTTALTAGARAITAKTINSAAQESSDSTAENHDVPDTVNPVISLLGNASEAYTIGGTYTDAGATATDNLDDDATLTSQIVAVITDNSTGNVISALDSTTPVGNYTITYTATDSAGNSASVTRAVEVQSAIVFLEDLKGQGPIYNDSSSARDSGLRIDLDTDGVISYDSGGDPVNQEFTISFWAELDAPADAVNVGLMGVNDWSTGSGNRRFKIDLGGGTALTSANMTCYFGPGSGGTNTLFNNSANLNLANTYTHFAFVAKSDGANLKFRIYVNGNQLSGVGTFPLGTKLLPKSNNEYFTFGGRGVQSKSVKGNFDSMQIADGVALEALQVQAIANQSDRQMTIATAAAVDVTAPIITVTNTDTSADITNTTVNLTEGDTFNFSATTDDGSSVTQGGDTLLLNTAGTYNLTFDSTDAAGNAADQKTLQVIVAAVPAFSAQELKRLGVASSGTWANYSLGASYHRDSSMGNPDPSAPTTNAASYAVSNSIRDAEIATFKESLDIASMSVGQTYHVQWRRGRNLGKTTGVAQNTYLSLIDFAGLENLYTSTFGGTLGSTGAAAWTGSGTDGVNAVKHARHQSEIVYKMQHANATHATSAGYRGASYIERTDGTNQTQRQAIDSTTFTTYTLNTESNYNPVIHWYDLHRFTIEKTVSGFDIGLDIHDGSSWSTYVGTGGSLQATPWSVTSLPNTLNVVVFNDQGSENRAGGPILPFIDVAITLS